MITPTVPWKRFALLGLGTLAAFYIFSQSITSVGQLAGVLRDARIPLVLAAVVAILPTPMLSGIRWYAVLRAAGHHFSFWRIIRITIAAMTFIALPGRLGDFIRANPLRNELRVSRTAATIILEKILDVTVLWWFSAIGLLTLGKEMSSAAAFGAGCAAFGLAALGTQLARLAPAGSLTEKLGVVGHTFREARRRPGWLATALAVSTLNWGTSFVSTWFAFQAFGSGVPFAVIFAFLPLAVFAGLIPFGIAGTGTRDGAFLAVFTSYAPAPVILATSITYTALGYVLFALIGIPFLRHLQSPTAS